MKLILDTHVWIWAEEDPNLLGKRTRKLLSDKGHVNLVSTISTLELARLISLDQIRVSIPLLEWVKNSVDSLHASVVPLSNEIAVEAYTLPGTFHADPADRILVATARLLDAVLITADKRILSYAKVKSIDARK